VYRGSALLGHRLYRRGFLNRRGGCECQGDFGDGQFYLSHIVPCDLIGHPVSPWLLRRDVTDSIGGLSSKVSVRRTNGGASACCMIGHPCKGSGHTYRFNFLSPRHNPVQQGNVIRSFCHCCFLKQDLKNRRGQWHFNFIIDCNAGLTLRGLIVTSVTETVPKTTNVSKSTITKLSWKHLTLIYAPGLI
jgi:hypothetical protein